MSDIFHRSAASSSKASNLFASSAQDDNGGTSKTGDPEKALTSKHFQKLTETRVGEEATITYKTET